MGLTKRSMEEEHEWGYSSPSPNLAVCPEHVSDPYLTDQLRRAVASGTVVPTARRMGRVHPALL